ncbi:hypothetical protein [Streptomyces sp. AC512_CC834]|uniref:hypothetical protein n=1 Tax=Streptomyces sp. AC512_CC834 TaxID=2823691 RepID=UPI001C26DD67|nr:hypothetical protein [Streptomyces sp. AC512_CC834]
MEAELMALIGTGATTVVGLMVTDAWEQVRHRVVGLFASDSDADADSDADGVAGELEESRTALVAAGGTADEEGLRSDLTASVRLRLRRLLEQDPGASEELRRLVDEFAPTARSEPPGSVHNSVTGGRQHGPVVQGHTFTNLTFRTAGGTAQDQAD